jgi:hypothetical protein
VELTTWYLVAPLRLLQLSGHNAPQGRKRKKLNEIGYSSDSVAAASTKSGEQFG